MMWSKLKKFLKHPIVAPVAVALLTAPCTYVVANWDKARDVGALVKESVETKAERFYDRGVVSAAKGDYDTAVTMYSMAVELRPNFPQAHNNLGVALLARGEPNRARKSFEAAVRQRPERARYHNNLGKARIESGDPAGAASSFDKAIRLEYTLAEAHVNRGLLHERLCEDAKAEGEYRIAIKVNEGLLEPRIALGNLLHKKRLFEAARIEFGRVLEIDSGSYSAHYNIANTLFDQENWLGAIREYEKAIDLKPDHSEALNGLGSCFLERGDPASAVGCFERALTVAPRNAQAMFNLAEALMALENAGKDEYAKAVEHLHTAITLDPDYLTFYLARLGRALLETGDADGAVYFLGRSLREHEPADNLLFTEAEQAQAQFALARAYARQGRAGEAIDALRRALSLEPSLRDNIRGCSDFDEIRERPEFRTLVD